MVDVSYVQDIPIRVMDMLMIILAARSRGEDACLILETKKTNLTTKYRSVETVTGAPAAATCTTTSKKQQNPARAKRSQLRLEKFQKKKIENKNQPTGDQEEVAAGDTNRKTKLVLQLPQGDHHPVPVETSLPPT